MGTRVSGTARACAEKVLTQGGSIMGKVAEHLNVLGKMLIDHAFGTTYQDVEDEEE